MDIFFSLLSLNFFLVPQSCSQNVMLPPNPSSMLSEISGIKIVISGIRNIGYQKYWVSEILGIRNIGYQKYGVSEISGIRNKVLFIKNIGYQKYWESEILGIWNIGYLRYRLSEVSYIRNIGYQKYCLSDILGILNIGYQNKYIIYHRKSTQSQISSKVIILLFEKATIYLRLSIIRWKPK